MGTDAEAVTGLYDPFPRRRSRAPSQEKSNPDFSFSLLPWKKEALFSFFDKYSAFF